MVQAVFAFLLLVLVSVLTLIFGTKESPFFYTMSGIGNDCGYQLSFIIWGVVRELVLSGFTLYLFKKAGYKDWRVRIVLFSSIVCLVVTVLTPAIRGMFPFLYFVHVVFSSLFAVLLVTAVLLFIQYIARSDRAVQNRAVLAAFMYRVLAADAAFDGA